MFTVLEMLSHDHFIYLLLPILAALLLSLLTLMTLTRRGRAEFRIKGFGVTLEVRKDPNDTSNEQ
jgi:hypothetical protein